MKHLVPAGFHLVLLVLLVSACGPGKTIEGERLECEDSSGCPLEDGFYCEKPPGDCSGGGFCAAVPTDCGMESQPVCGCDSKTHLNPCGAAAHGASVWFDGVCVTCQSNADCADLSDNFCIKIKWNCDGVGWCSEIPTGCTGNVDEVCGCDGQTHDGDCWAHSEGVSVDHDGACP